MLTSQSPRRWTPPTWHTQGEIDRRRARTPHSGRYKAHAAHHRAYRRTYATFGPQTVPKIDPWRSQGPSHDRTRATAPALPRSHVSLFAKRSRRTAALPELLAAAEVEVEVVLGGHAAWPPPPAAGGTLRPAPVPPSSAQQRGSREEDAARRAASTTNATDRRSLPHTIVCISTRRCR